MKVGQDERRFGEGWCLQRADSGSKVTWLADIGNKAAHGETERASSEDADVTDT